MSIVFAPPPPPPPPAPPIPPLAAPEPPPHKTRWWKHPWLWAGVVVAFFAIGAVATAVSGKQGAKATVETTVAATDTPGVQPTEPASAPRTTAAPTTLAPVTTLSERAAFLDWVITSDAMPLMTGFSDATMLASNADDAASMYTACQSVHDANEDLHAILPSPSAEYNAAMEQMYAHIDTATHYCMDGSLTYDTTKLSLTVEYLNMGTDDLNRATAIMDAMD